MGSLTEIYVDRANNEIMVAESLKRLSEKEEDKVNFDLPDDISFYSSVISHSYYAIFYAAKALLLIKGIETKAPEVHKKTFEEFKQKFVDTKELDVSLLKIYKKMMVRADELLEIFKDEKWKRGHFTYQTIPQANKEPAEDSLKNAKFFVSNIMRVIKESNSRGEK
ncbi:MAG: HEPN domain-containing protein [Nanoarchaeota archaeon]|nr:HEPN domain-containing protein [Nanoarchaeota archaeon]MBU1322178.1 HEPN domain-containing protein [Nanoarchaeota archaeon]MBU1597719.1 HEPN domain-containing protein [Nanoarchaeota archaeon]MBU2442197.1 HEPN domain-containing protein [Nanoarchaeota archaeon]